ncbi:unnamed protein product [Closterium sp. NIES-53]
MPLKPQRPPCLDSSQRGGPTVQAWLFMMNVFFDANYVSEDTAKIRYAVSLLQGPAMDWWRVIVTKPTEYATLPTREGQTGPWAPSYFIEVPQYHIRTRSVQVGYMHESERIDRYIGGLKHEIAQEIQLRGVTDFQEILAMAEKLDFFRRPRLGSYGNKGGSHSLINTAKTWKLKLPLDKCLPEIDARLVNGTPLAIRERVDRVRIRCVRGPLSEGLGFESQCVHFGHHSAGGVSEVHWRCLHSLCVRLVPVGVLAAALSGPSVPPLRSSLSPYLLLHPPVLSPPPLYPPPTLPTPLLDPLLPLSLPEPHLPNPLPPLYPRPLSAALAPAPPPSPHPEARRPEPATRAGSPAAASAVPPLRPSWSAPPAVPSAHLPPAPPDPAADVVPTVPRRPAVPPQPSAPTVPQPVSPLPPPIVPAVSLELPPCV